MAYDRYDRENERSRWSDDDRDFRRERGFGHGRTDYSRGGRSDYGDRGRDERGFFDRAGDEIASWFGDEEAERRRHQDRARDEREDRFTTRRERGEHRGAFFGGGRDEDRGRYWRDQTWDRGDFERDYGHGSTRSFRGDRERGYRPMTGDYGRGEHESEEFFAASGVGRGERGFGDYRSDFARTDRSRERDFDPHYRSWRDRHMSELDRDYDDYARENQSRFESDFGSWRERREQKRGLLGQIREHMEVVGNDDEHVGTVDKVAGDRIILAKSDPESGGAHHSLSCADIDRVEGDRVILDCSATEARVRWRDESRGRALFEREDQGEMGPRMLDRSFEGTYR